jgi:hypothetical protein
MEGSRFALGGAERDAECACRRDPMSRRPRDPGSESRRPDHFPKKITRFRAISRLFLRGLSGQRRARFSAAPPFCPRFPGGHGPRPGTPPGARRTKTGHSVRAESDGGWARRAGVVAAARHRQTKSPERVTPFSSPPARVHSRRVLRRQRQRQTWPTTPSRRPLRQGQDRVRSSSQRSCRHCYLFRLFMTHLLRRPETFSPATTRPSGNTAMPHSFVR